jgi:hypothetical protein
VRRIKGGRRDLKVVAGVYRLAGDEAISAAEVPDSGEEI